MFRSGPCLIEYMPDKSKSKLFLTYTGGQSKDIKLVQPRNQYVVDSELFSPASSRSHVSIVTSLFHNSTFSLNLFPSSIHHYQFIIIYITYIYIYIYIYIHWDKHASVDIFTTNAVLTFFVHTQCSIGWGSANIWAGIIEIRVVLPLCTLGQVENFSLFVILIYFYYYL